MSPLTFSPEWLKTLTDPYAVMGVSVAADERRLLKRYRTVAKTLHPDSHSLSDPAVQSLATQLFARLVNPSYQKLKQEKGRMENLALLRFQVRRLSRQTDHTPKSETAQQLSQLPLTEAEVFYEQAVERLAELQYQDLTQFVNITLQLSELNLVYLQLKMDDLYIREKRTGLISAAEVSFADISFSDFSTPTPVTTPEAKPQPIVFAQKHYERAQEYMGKSEWMQAVQELRDAIKIDPAQSDYHALLGLAYFNQKLLGMAAVYFRQALKLDPRNSLALKYATHLKITLPTATPNKATQTKSVPAKSPKVHPAEPKKKGLFGFFGLGKP